jgi:hypothetical protein
MPYDICVNGKPPSPLRIREIGWYSDKDCGLFFLGVNAIKDDVRASGSFALK